MSTSTDITFPDSLFYIVGITTVVWLAVTFLTRPVDQSRLQEFYRRVHPGGIGWKRVAALTPGVRGDSGYGWLFLDWICGCILVYTVLFGTGKLIFGDYTTGLLMLVLAAAAAAFIYWDLSRRGWEEVAR